MLTPPDLPKFLQEMLPEGIERHMVQIEDQQIHFLTRGMGTPIFMMHGNPTWSFLYRDIMAALDPEKFQCIVPDLVGLGCSTKPTSSSWHTLENHQRIMGEFVKQQITGDFIFLGQDWGGPIGLLAAMQSAHNIRGMVILNTSLRPPRPGFKATTFHRLSQTPIISDVLFRMLGFPQRGLHRVQGDANSIQGKVRNAYVYPLRRYKDRAAPLAMARMVPDSLNHPSVPWMQKTNDFAGSFEGPVHLFWGTKDPILGRLHKAHKKLITDAEVTLTEGGHFIQEEYPAEIAATLRKVAEKAGF